VRRFWERARGSAPRSRPRPDTIEWVAVTGLEAVARAHARIIDDANRLERKDLLPGARMTTSAQ
jgi:hypothetical protein